MTQYTPERIELQNDDWQSILAQAVRSPRELLELLGLQSSGLAQQLHVDKAFGVLVPRTYIALMQHGDENDPLLRQVLSVQDEQLEVAGYTKDPLGELETNVQPGVIHKYHGRLLLVVAGGCAVNCRYCFRRHFPYGDNAVGRKQWQASLDYVAQDASISEVILSGGDPLLISDEALADLLAQIEAIPHVQRLRIHSRLPVVIAQRLTDRLIRMLASSRQQVSMVLHINHARELSASHRPYLEACRQAGISLLNQSVLLKGVNDDEQQLCQLSETLFAYGILPYYLHQLDRVQGAQHFAVSDERMRVLYRYMLDHLPGYLVPRLAREEAGRTSKTLIKL